MSEASQPIRMLGKEVAAAVEADLQAEMASSGLKPGLAVVLVGEDPASQIYVRHKEAACQRLGFHSEMVNLSADTSQDRLLHIISDLNRNPAIHGILVQMPLPPQIDPEAIAVVGTSYGGYLACILTELRRIRWLALRVPALYRDEDWDRPKRELPRDDLMAYRSSRVPAASNRALRACAAFTGDVLLVQSEHDDFIPRATILSYRAAFQQTHSLTHRIIDQADHALSTELAQDAYTDILVRWITEMVVGERANRLVLG